MKLKLKNISRHRYELSVYKPKTHKEGTIMAGHSSINYLATLGQYDLAAQSKVT